MYTFAIHILRARLTPFEESCNTLIVFPFSIPLTLSIISFSSGKAKQVVVSDIKETIMLSGNHLR